MEESQFFESFHIANLNPQQGKAVRKVDGATLLLAVPGSGKTTVIVARIGYMVHVKNIKPFNILTLTYTRAAAQEMKERYIKKFGTSDMGTPYFSTINAFCYSVVRRCSSEKGVNLPELLSSNEPVIRQIAASMMAEYPSDATVRLLAQQVGKVKNEMLTSEQIGSIENEYVDFADFYREYNLYLSDNNLMDFDDQLKLAYQYLQEYPDILRRAQQRYKYVSLDEAQDTSLIQHKIVQMLVGKNGNIFMVGDEDQSIYGFRGAYPSALLSFSKDYNNAEVLFMETNYRSDKKIVNTADKFIKCNKNRNNKNMVPFSKKEGEITFTRISDLKDQPEILLEEIQNHLKRNDGTSLAILYRNNDSCVPLTNLLIQNGISVKQRDSFDTFFSHFVIADILDIMRFSLDQRNEALFYRFYYKMGIYIKKEALKPMGEYLETHPKDTIMHYVARMPSMKRFAYRLPFIESKFNIMPKMTPMQAINEILYGYMDYWKSWVERKIEDGASEFALQMKICALKSVANNYKTLPEFFEALEKIKNVQTKPNSSVTLSTLHSSKGLEFDRVIMIDVIDGILPANADKMEEGEREEEARLFYVGITRARHKLDFLVGLSYFSTPITASEFFNDEQAKIPAKVANQ